MRLSVFLLPVEKNDGTEKILSFKMVKNQLSKYLFELMLVARRACMARYTNSIPHLNIKNDYLKNHLEKYIHTWEAL